MSVFNEIAPDTQNTNRMKQWLLNQKRTQNWESVPATVNAIYALLLTGSDWLNTQNTCVATWDGKTYSTAEGEIATGYLKKILPNEPANNSANPVLDPQGRKHAGMGSCLRAILPRDRQGKRTKRGVECREEIIRRDQ